MDCIVWPGQIQFDFLLCKFSRISFKRFSSWPTLANWRPKIWRFSSIWRRFSLISRCSWPESFRILFRFGKMFRLKSWPRFSFSWPSRTRSESILCVAARCVSSIESIIFSRHSSRFFCEFRKSFSISRLSIKVNKFRARSLGVKQLVDIFDVFFSKFDDSKIELTQFQSFSFETIRFDENLSETWVRCDDPRFERNFSWALVRIEI